MSSMINNPISTSRIPATYPSIDRLSCWPSTGEMLWKNPQARLFTGLFTSMISVCNERNRTGNAAHGWRRLRSVMEENLFSGPINLRFGKWTTLQGDLSDSNETPFASLVKGHSDHSCHILNATFGIQTVCIYVRLCNCLSVSSAEFGCTWQSKVVVYQTLFLGVEGEKVSRILCPSTSNCMRWGGKVRKKTPKNLAVHQRVKHFEFNKDYGNLSADVHIITAHTTWHIVWV